MKILFWGSSELSLPFLKLLTANKEIFIKYVITKPDKPSGRGLHIKPGVVKKFAMDNILEVLTPEDINNEVLISMIRKELIDLSVVVSYGKIIPQSIIDIHRLGIINVHFSLLPRYRGAAPIQWALINGEYKTGVTIFWLNNEMDAGDIFLQKEQIIDNTDNYYSLSAKLVEIGKNLLEDTIKNIISGKIIRIPQVGDPTYAPLIKKENGIINWNITSFRIHNLVRALVSWPKATTKIRINNKEISLKILETLPLDFYDVSIYKENISPGTIVDVCDGYLVVLCGNNTYLKIIKIQPENKNILTSKQFICGYRIKKYDKFI
ncbi:MAG: methionyl-tRNA formyltransferase [Endomicrobia bacterium]|nr:methionyl-tRNA formyltransferase [Endomicrobiia bacterium]